MNHIQKYYWLIDTIKSAGKITYKDISNKWERAEGNDDGTPLSRTTFNRWKAAIRAQLGISILCQHTGEYLYYVDNYEDIDHPDKLKQWMLNTFAVGNIINGNLSLKERILVREIPSGREHLTTMLEAMKNNRVVTITYHPFNKEHSDPFPMKPYCVKLFENRWYVLGLDPNKEFRLYSLDRIENAELTDKTFKLPNDFDAEEYFSTAYGIVVDHNVKPERIVLRADEFYKHYLKSLPLHHSQNLLKDCGEYADFELYLAPTYDFVKKLLSIGARIEVLEPLSLRKTMEGWISDMHKLYKNVKLRQ